jgi:hypothetical protein
MIPANGAPHDLGARDVLRSLSFAQRRARDNSNQVGRLRCGEETRCSFRSPSWSARQGRPFRAQSAEARQRRPVIREISHRLGLSFLHERYAYPEKDISFLKGLVVMSVIADIQPPLTTITQVV